MTGYLRLWCSGMCGVPVHQITWCHISAYQILGVPTHKTAWCHISAGHNVRCTYLPDHTVSRFNTIKHGVPTYQTTRYHVSTPWCLVCLPTRTHGVMFQHHDAWCAYLPEHTVSCFNTMMLGVPTYQTARCHISAGRNVWCAYLSDRTVSHLSRT